MDVAAASNAQSLLWGIETSRVDTSAGGAALIDVDADEAASVRCAPRVPRRS
jgi:hypothetical protein